MPNNPIEGQGSLEFEPTITNFSEEVNQPQGIEPIDERRSDIQKDDKPKLVAFGGFVKAELYDIFGEHDLEDLSDSEKSWMNAKKLRELVLSPYDSDKFLVDRVSLNSFEYNLIARSPFHLGKFATARVLNDNDIDDERIMASQRAPIHVFEQKIVGMEAHTKKLYEI